MKVTLKLRNGIWWARWTEDGRTVGRSMRTKDRALAERTVASWSPEPVHVARDEWGLVYFVEAVGCSRIKIGWTRTGKLEARVAALQIGSPFPLRVIATYEGRLLEEHMEHIRFQDLWLHGEWFRCSAALEDRLTELVREPLVDHKPQG